MVGGIVCETLVQNGRIYINVQDKTYGNDFCAVNVEVDNTSARIRKGDSLWWQGSSAYWTPQENAERSEEELKCGRDYDIEIKRIGYSGVKHPGESLIESAFSAA